MASEPSAQAPASSDSAFGRIFGVFFSPGKTFEAIALRPTWFAPLVLWLLCSVGVSAVVLPRVDFEKLTRDRIEKSGRPLPEDQIQTMVDRQRKVAPIVGYCISVIAPIFISLVVAVTLWGSFRAFGWDATFRQSLGATTHAFLPGVLGTLLLLPLLLRQDRVDPDAIGDMLRSNLGFLVERSSKALHSLLGSVDLFSFWTLAMLVVGFAAAARIRRGQAAGVVVGLWLVYVLGKAGISALF
ncbi:MAG TPA: YIP1 family protein [Thermoanaerobaculia bacterium]|nr:YIP1 family protein [Thermoanaerobaculia bacterium]